MFEKWFSGEHLLRTRILLFSAICVGALLLQGLRWGYFSISDGPLWGQEAATLLYGGSEEFDFLGAYGHPGGPILEGVLVLWKLFGVSPTYAVIFCVTLYAALLITAICAACFYVRKDLYWVSGVFGILSLNWLYTYATPPSAVAPLLVVLLFLTTWQLYESEKASNISLATWGAVAGLAVSTRADIGAVSAAVFFALLLCKVDWKRLLYVFLEAVGVFVLTDPFMWFMPLRHVKDLVFKVVYHYAEFTPTHISMHSLAAISAFACASALLAISFMFGKQKKFAPVPLVLISALLCFTVFLYAIFLSAHYQAERYFLPIIFIWETLLPLFVCTYIDQNTKTLSTLGLTRELSGSLLKIGFLAAIFMYHAYILILSFELYARFS